MGSLLQQLKQAGHPHTHSQTNSKMARFLILTIALIGLVAGDGTGHAHHDHGDHAHGEHHHAEHKTVAEQVPDAYNAPQAYAAPEAPTYNAPQGYAAPENAPTYAANAVSAPEIDLSKLLGVFSSEYFPVFLAVFVGIIVANIFLPLIAPLLALIPGFGVDQPLLAALLGLIPANQIVFST